MNLSHVLAIGRHRWPVVLVLALFTALSVCASSATTAGPAHGYSPVHELKYEPGFHHFDYVNPKAPKGGTLRLGAIDTFDSLNTLRYPGRTPSSRPERFNIRDLIYDTLLVKSADEPAAYYGLLARTVEVAQDHSWARFVLRGEARWHDGNRVTAHDVAFTFATLRTQGPPYARQILRGIEVVVESETTVLIKAPRPGNRDFTARVGTIPIHPKHFWSANDVQTGGMVTPLGSGPYRVARVDAGRKIVFERVETYWAAKHQVNVGRHNFKNVEVKFFRDSTVMLEAFKANNIDLKVEQDAVRWATGYAGSALNDGRIVKETFTGSAPGQLMSLVFNLRHSKFKDLRVRRALALAYDFTWTNEQLFHGQYEPVESFFGHTRNAASGAAGKGERALLAPYLAKLPDGILRAGSADEKNPIRGRRTALQEASRLLSEAGFEVREGARIDPTTGKQFTIQLVYLNPRLRRVFGPFAKSLAKIGIKLSYPSLEPVTASKTILGHDFDMAALERWEPDLVPGTAESLVWGSALADKTPSYALSGAKDAALDATIAAMSQARSLEGLEDAARAFDRVLRWQQYAIPMWRSSKLWVARWKLFALPSYDGLDLRSLIDLAWHKGNAPNSPGQ